MSENKVKGLGAFILGLYAVLALTACGSSSGSGGGGGVVANNPAPSSSSSPSAFPDAVDNFEPDNSAVTASSIGVGDAVQVRTIFPVQDRDWVAVNLTAGVAYEFFTTNLNATGDTMIYLYAPDGKKIIRNNDDYLYRDSRVEYKPIADGTYYIKVRPYDEVYGIVSYSLGVREFVDVDSDGMSAFYDCDDSIDTIYPFATAVPGDGIDQTCSGTDELVDTTADSAEPDNVFADAAAMGEAGGSGFEIIYRDDIYSGNERTIHAAGEIDFFVVTVPANTAFEFHWESKLQLLATIYDSDGTTALDTSTGLFRIEKDAVSHTYYVSFEAENGTDTVYYVPFYYSLGMDQDNDSHYSLDWDIYYDCNDSDPDIYVGATETAADGIDSNCNGDDHT